MAMQGSQISELQNIKQAKMQTITGMSQVERQFIWLLKFYLKRITLMNLTSMPLELSYSS